MRGRIDAISATAGRNNLCQFVPMRYSASAIARISSTRSSGVPSQAVPIVRASASGVGDRRDHDIITVGEESARIFDEIIIKQDEDLRGPVQLEQGAGSRREVRHAGERSADVRNRHSGVRNCHGQGLA